MTRKLQVTHLSKMYDRQPVLQEISFAVPQGEVFCILGRSGGGKTTLLKCLAGLEEPDAGQVFWGGEELTRVPANRRNLLYLYQEPLLFPHLTARENIAFGLQVRGRPKAEIREQVEAYLRELGLDDHGHKYPHQLSGGQKQRVNFGRALIVNPRVLLLDEPFGKLDAQTRAAMQALYQNVCRTHGITSVFVTHDAKEALLVGNTFGRLEDGRLDLFSSTLNFVRDPRNGVQEEIDFWKGISEK